MTVGAFELDVLGRVANDYEAVETIRSDLARDLVREVSEVEVGSALLSLARYGLVDVYIYDHALGNYVRAVPENYPVEDLWFMTNKPGRAYLQQQERPL